MKNNRKEIKCALPIEVWNRLEMISIHAGQPIANILLDAALAYLDSLDKDVASQNNKNEKEYIDGWHDGRNEGFDAGFEAGEAHAYNVLMRQLKNRMNGEYEQGIEE